jgi:ABC-type branched-subunit amino acid transport system ATPase component
MTALVLDGLSVRYGGVAALDGLTLRHDAGGVVGLIGPNGAGKTTLLNVLSGVVRPTGGTALLDGADLGRLPVHRISALGVARTFQDLKVFSSLTALENVLVPATARAGLAAAALGRGEAARRTAAAGLLDRVGLAAVAGVPAGALPYGMQRRLELARALAARPRLLLLDEPLAGLSGAESGELTALVAGIAAGDSDFAGSAGGVTVLLVEHDVASVLAVSDRVVVLDHGALLADGAPAEVRADPAVRAAYLGGEWAAT